MKSGVEIINIMADGTRCDDLESYVGADHKLPELARVIMIEIMRKGAETLGG